MSDTTATPTPALRWKHSTVNEANFRWGRKPVLQQLWEIREGTACRQEWRAVPEVAADAPDLTSSVDVPS